MPLYDYECNKCGKQVEMLVKATPTLPDGASTPPLAVMCGDCGGEMTRMLTKANFTLKTGRGFYGSRPK